MPLPFGAVARPRPVAQRNERLFVALWPDDATRARLADAALRLRPVGRPVAAANLHLTLAFLGSVPAARRAVAARAMRAAGVGAVDLVLDRWGHFPGARVAWVGPAAPPAALAGGQQRLAARLREAGFTLEHRAFHPHVTLARDCARPTVPGLAPIPWPARRLALVRSHTGAGGARYEVVDAVDLD
ncbi:MAG: RNA 2',3'-cyclic phosphodiesterase [Burkholderiales bacterium]|nr:RNA 2',3'-cyclic phosphodiesterase [Burkholderiales bacterium]